MHPTMALVRRRPVFLVALLSMVSFLAAPALAAGKTGQVTVFWGRNGRNGSLREACDTGLYTMVIMSFLDAFGQGNRYHLDILGQDLATIGADIKYCQSKGLAVSLSLGGLGAEYSLPSDRSALDLSDHLWNSYLGGSDPGVPRPFGDAWLDGVDLFLLHGTPADRYDVLALDLAKREGKPLHLTATVACAYPPAAHVARALATGVFEHVHLSIYEGGTNVYGAWAWRYSWSWDEFTAAYPATRFYIGFTALYSWIQPRDLYDTLIVVAQKKDNYGGIMLWHRYLDIQSGYGWWYKRFA